MAPQRQEAVQNTTRSKTSVYNGGDRAPADASRPTASISFTNIEKELFPEAGLTKGDIIGYYDAVAPYILPHLAGRPVTLKRFPNGIGEKWFYEKRCPAYRPAWMSTAEVPRAGRQPAISYCVINSRDELLWVANQAAIELHVLQSRSDDLGRPTGMVFDLDPGPPAGLAEAGQVALFVRELLRHAGLQSWVKSSGGKGLHVTVPLNTEVTFDETKQFARMVAREMERRHSSLVISRMTRDLRQGKVFIDWSQNDRFKTTVAVYSLRARPLPTVSVPISWENLLAALERGAEKKLLVPLVDAPGLLAEQGDLFADLLDNRQTLPPLSALERQLRTLPPLREVC